MAQIKLMDSMGEVVKDVERKFIKAGIGTVNNLAAVSRANAQRNIKENFTTRNNFTVNSVVFDKCDPNVQTLSEIKAEMGLLPKAGYMRLHETGGVKTAKTGANLIIPTTNARLGNNAYRVKEFYKYKNVRNNFYPRKLNGQPSRSKQALILASFYAAKNRGFVRVDNILYQVRKFRPAGGKLFSATPILNMKHKSAFLPDRPWMKPAIERAENLTQKIFNQQMDKLK